MQRTPGPLRRQPARQRQATPPPSSTTHNLRWTAVTRRPPTARRTRPSPSVPAAPTAPTAPASPLPTQRQQPSSRSMPQKKSWSGRSWGRLVPPACQPISRWLREGRVARRGRRACSSSRPSTPTGQPRGGWGTRGAPCPSAVRQPAQHTHTHTHTQILPCCIGVKSRCFCLQLSLTWPSTGTPK